MIPRVGCFFRMQRLSLLDAPFGHPRRMLHIVLMRLRLGRWTALGHSFLGPSRGLGRVDIPQAEVPP